MMKWLGHHWGLKIISLVLAAGLWYYAVGEESIEVTRVIPLKVTVSDPKMLIAEISAQDVQATFATPRSLVVSLADRDIQAVHVIGPEIKTAGEYSFRVEPSEVRVPDFQIRVLDITPEAVTVKLDEVVAQKLEIRPDFVGEPAIGYKLLSEEVRVNPNALLAQGPKGVLESMKEVLTEPIDLVGRIRSFNRTVRVKLPPSVTPLSEALVDVLIPLREEFNDKEFRDVPVRVLNLPELNRDVELLPEKITFILKGSKRLLEKLSPEGLLAYVDLSGLKKGEYELPLQVVLPEEVSMKNEQPILVKVVIRASPK
ncbi:MAG: hypothetical protein KTQ49_03325 [Candidatus Omnitrophica bacterium]|nr:hypothetical protein [Candidatus Omnitrophota bacterium]